MKTITEKYLPQQGYGENLAETTVTCINRIVYRWWNDGEGIYNDDTGCIIGDDFWGMGRNTACFEFLIAHPKFTGIEFTTPRNEKEYDELMKKLEKHMETEEFAKLMAELEKQSNAEHLKQIENDEVAYRNQVEELSREDDEDEYY